MTAVLNVVYSVMIPIFGIMGLAALTGRRFNIPTEFLSALVIYLFSPALVLISLVNTQISLDEMGKIASMAILSSLLLLLVGWLVAKGMRFPSKLEAAFLSAIVIGNTGSFGLPLVEFSLGSEALNRALVFWTVTVVLVNTLGVYLPLRADMSVKASIKELLRLPLLHATIVGLLFKISGIELPVPVDRVATYLGQAAVPCSLVILGLQITKMSVKGQVLPILLASSIRLIVAPLVGFVLALLLGISGITRLVSIIQISVPTATVTAIFANQFGGDEDFSSAVVLTTTLASIFTLSILLLVLLK